MNCETLAGLSIHTGDVLVVDRGGDIEPGRAVIVVTNCALLATIGGIVTRGVSA